MTAAMTQIPVPTAAKNEIVTPLWTEKEVYPSFCPLSRRLSTQVEEELAHFLGIILISP
jgi:hypothetical protein